MKSIIWKEFRENLKWLPLPGLVILLVFLIDKPDEPMLDPMDTYFFCLTAVVFGAALGFMQVFFEAHGDKRSLLLHRPLSLSGIFLAKAIAGLGLYVLALGIPFACLEIWLAMPGSMPAPYHWRTSLPWLADILSGIVYYFAGMLIAQREARWYGSRGQALAAAFFCSYWVWALPEFLQALAAIAILGLLVGVAAWGSFCAGGAYAPQPRLAKAALATTFLVGLWIASMLGKQLIGEWCDPGLEGNYRLDRQGRVLFGFRKVGVGAVGPLMDLSGQELPEFKADNTTMATLAATATPLTWSYRNSGRFYVECKNDSKPGNLTTTSRAAWSVTMCTITTSLEALARMVLLLPDRSQESASRKSFDTVASVGGPTSRSSWPFQAAFTRSIFLGARSRHFLLPPRENPSPMQVRGAMSWIRSDSLS
jgi:hypothetical protein